MKKHVLSQPFKFPPAPPRCPPTTRDRRTMVGQAGGGGDGGGARPAGVLIGHTEGITHIDSKGDGRYFISNCKDQTVKLWDVRRMSDASAAAAKTKERPLPVWNWDYRYMRFPGTGWDMKHPDDASLQTYSGHLVDQTLIRAYFSPAATTGQRYIYSGSSDGVVAFWDVVSGKRVGDEERFGGGGGGGSGEEDDGEDGDGGGGAKRRRRGRGDRHGGNDDCDDGDGGGERGYARGGVANRTRATTGAGSASPRRRPTSVSGRPGGGGGGGGGARYGQQHIRGGGNRGPVIRDVSWHPTQPMLVSVAWDGSVVRWDAGG